MLRSTFGSDIFCEFKAVVIFNLYKQSLQQNKTVSVVISTYLSFHCWELSFSVFEITQYQNWLKNIPHLWLNLLFGLSSKQQKKLWIKISCTYWNQWASCQSPVSCTVASSGYRTRCNSGKNSSPWNEKREKHFRCSCTQKLENILYCKCAS